MVRKNGQPKYSLEELRSMMNPGQLKMADRYVAQLPAGSTVSKPDFCAACGNLHPDSVQAMIDGRELDAADWGSGSKSYWHINRESAILQIHRRILGIRRSYI
jgi:hypothetical protein